MGVLIYQPNHSENCLKTMIGELPGPTKNIFISSPNPNCTIQFITNATPHKLMKIHVAEA